jgi:hypothetical protein
VEDDVLLQGDRAGTERSSADASRISFGLIKARSRNHGLITIMKFIIILLIVATFGSVVFLTACNKSGGSSMQADVDAAIARGEHQFIGVMEGSGKINYPQVPGVPEWYFQVTGMRVRTVKPETREAELAYMKSYNEALYNTLKAQGKFDITEEKIATVKAFLDKKYTPPNKNP